MRLFTVLSLALGLLFLGADRVNAQDEAKAIIDKAIKAHGGADKLAKIDKDKATQMKAKGTLEISGLSIPFTEQSSMQPGRYKSVAELEVKGNTIKVITVFNGEKAWVNVQDKTMDLEGKALDELKDLLYLMRLGRFVFLKEKGPELSSIGEVKVNGRPALGVKVANKGHRDVNFFFDKETGLLAKIERQGVDPMTEKEYTEERIITEYQESDGLKNPKKAVVNRDGKKYLEVEILEVKYRDKFDDSEFAKP